MKNETPKNESGFNRRDFLKGSSAATLMAMLGGVPLVPEARAEDWEEEFDGSTVHCAVIGLGTWGREILANLSRQKGAEITAICDNYGPFLRRSATAYPNATATEDYKEVLANEEIQAVLIATPTHQHRDIVLAALAAGKHVYCEAPIAHTIEDARAIAKAAHAAKKQVFQVGLLSRSDPQRHFLLPFIRAGAMGRPVMARAQWHKKQSWRRASPNPEREKELNWRLSKSLSTGLAGELGIHQIDSASWFLNMRPTAVTGFGGILHWNDGRDVPDTVQAVFEFPRGIQFLYDSTLANSFDADYEMYYGTDSAVMIRENKAWMFKEVDSPLLGWEVYARKDVFYKETGIALMANATKLPAQGTKPAEEAPYAEMPLNYAMEAFVNNVREIGNAVEDYEAAFDVNDVKALEAYLANIKLMPAAGLREGFESVVTAIKANEAILSRQRIVLKDEWYEIA
jgi:predicted dehydrogenase